MRSAAGRRARATRLPAAAARTVIAGLVGGVLVAGCSNNAGGSPSTTTPASTAAALTTPAPPAPQSSSPGPVGLPVRSSPVPVKRTITRPPGAKLVDFSTCIAPTSIVSLYLRQQILDKNDRVLQEVQLENLPQLLDPQVKHLRRARATWLADGYPTGFPVVADLDGFLAVYAKLRTAARSKNLDAVPGLYLQLNKVIAQYGADAGDRVCAH